MSDDIPLLSNNDNTATIASTLPLPSSKTSANETVKAMAQFLGFSGALLLGMGTPVIVGIYSYTHTTPRSRVYCKDLDWYADDAASFDTGCRLSIGVDHICPEDLKAREYPATISESIEHWPYACSMLIGIGATNAFAGIMITDMLLRKGWIVALMAYGALLSFWGVVGSSAYSNDEIITRDLHYAAAGILIVFTVLVPLTAFYWARKTYLGFCGYILLVSTLVTGTGVLISGVVALTTKEPELEGKGTSQENPFSTSTSSLISSGNNYDRSLLRSPQYGWLAIFELLHIVSFSVLFLVMIQYALYREHDEQREEPKKNQSTDTIFRNKIASPQRYHQLMLRPDVVPFLARKQTNGFLHRT